jgi:flagellin
MVEGAIVRSTDGVNAVASQMSLSFSGNDRYSFSIDANGGGDGDADATVSADVLNGNLEGIRNVVNSHTATTGVTATIQGDELVLEKADGTAFDIHTFSSESGGQITAANAAGQGGSGVLENAGDGASVNIAESGAAVATEVVLTMSATAHADEKYSFKITDGSSTATVRATGTAAAVAADADTADLLAEIQSALSAANMSHITAAVSGSDDGTIVLTNALGGKVDIENFQSDKTGTMTVSPSSGQGVGKILDDDAISGAYDSVASIDALSASTAQLAVQAIDRALENINSQRSELGAISNRLDHTISNLGNIVVNTEASQSRIEDADFASETSNLTKAQILSQAATAMLAQANASKQSVLSLLQG